MGSLPLPMHAHWDLEPICKSALTPALSLLMGEGDCGWTVHGEGSHSIITLRDLLLLFGRLGFFHLLLFAFGLCHRLLLSLRSLDALLERGHDVHHGFLFFRSDDHFSAGDLCL